MAWSVTLVAAAPTTAPVPRTESVKSVAVSASPKSPRAVNSPGTKRGIVFDWLSSDYSKYFVGSSKVTYGSNWHATRDETGAKFDPSFAFIPTLRVDKNLKNDKWLATVKGLISGGVKTVFAYVTIEPLSRGRIDMVNPTHHRSSIQIQRTGPFGASQPDPGPSGSSVQGVHAASQRPWRQTLHPGNHQRRWEHGTQLLGKVCRRMLRLHFRRDQYTSLLVTERHGCGPSGDLAERVYRHDRPGRASQAPRVKRVTHHDRRG